MGHLSGASQSHFLPPGFSRVVSLCERLQSSQPGQHYANSIPAWLPSQGAWFEPLRTSLAAASLVMIPKTRSPRLWPALETGCFCLKLLMQLTERERRKGALFWKISAKTTRKSGWAKQCLEIRSPPSGDFLGSSPKWVPHKVIFHIIFLCYGTSGKWAL